MLVRLNGDGTSTTTTYKQRVVIFACVGTLNLKQTQQNKQNYVPAAWRAGVAPKGWRPIARNNQSLIHYKQ